MRFVKLLPALLCLFLFSACASPDDLMMDVYMGAGEELKLLHLNASNESRAKQIRGIASALQNAEKTEKPLELFAYYPDYKVVIQEKGKPKLTVILDINESFVEFYLPEATSPDDQVIYRSTMSADTFNSYLHQKPN